MKNRIAILVCAMVAVCIPVAAHHGGAAYDRTKTVTLKATITDFKFINPHVQIYFDVTDDKGNVEHWAGESPDDPAMLSRSGWTRHSLNVGDQVTIVGAPAKSGSKVISVQKVILPDGRELTNRIPNT